MSKCAKCGIDDDRKRYWDRSPDHALREMAQGNLRCAAEAVARAIKIVELLT